MDVFAEISEHVGLFESVQGNVNVMGLVWENDIDETLDLGQNLYTVWVEDLLDGFGVAVGYDPFHVLDLHETLTLNEIMGSVPLEVYHSNINVVHAREAAPVKIWWFGANVVHGPDVFFEEVLSNVHCRVTHTQAVPYYWRHIYESINFEFHNIQPHPGITKSLNMQTGDRINMRHTVWQEYFFNSLAQDQLFTYDGVAWGWKHDIDEPFAVDDYAIRHLGFKLIDYLFPGDAADSRVNIGIPVNDRLFAWDRGAIAHGWPKTLDDGFDVADKSVAPILTTLLESLGISADLSLTNWKAQLTAADHVKVQESATVVKFFMAMVADGVITTETVTDTLVKTYQETVSDGFGFEGSIN
jgi:hypothetical protein